VTAKFKKGFPPPASVSIAILKEGFVDTAALINSMPGTGLVEFPAMTRPALLLYDVDAM